MLQRIKWELRYCKKEACMQLLIQAVYPVVILLLYKVRKEWLFGVASAVFSLPQELYAFVGLNSSVTTGNFYFYILFGAMFINVWMAWKACLRTLRLLQADEQTGSIGCICDQWYSRKRIGVCKLLCSLIVFMAQHTLWYVFALLITMAGSYNGEQRITALGYLIMLWLRAAIVCCVLIVLTFSMGVYLKYPVMMGMQWADGFFVVSLTVGNLHKLRDLFIWFIESLQMESFFVLDKMGWLDYGIWLSPLSWLNPFADFNGATSFFQFLICAVLAGVGVWMGQKGYIQRRIVL